MQPLEAGKLGMISPSNLSYFGPSLSLFKPLNAPDSVANFYQSVLSPNILDLRVLSFFSTTFYPVRDKNFWEKRRLNPVAFQKTYLTIFRRIEAGFSYSWRHLVATVRQVFGFDNEFFFILVK